MSKSTSVHPITTPKTQREDIKQRLEEIAMDFCIERLWWHDFGPQHAQDVLEDIWPEIDDHTFSCLANPKTSRKAFAQVENMLKARILEYIGRMTVRRASMSRNLMPPVALNAPSSRQIALQIAKPPSYYLDYSKWYLRSRVNLVTNGIEAKDKAWVREAVVLKTLEKQQDLAHILSEKYRKRLDQWRVSLVIRQFRDSLALA